MIRQLFSGGPVLVVALVLTLAGCRPQQPFYFHEDGDLSHYVGVATEIEYPDVDLSSLDEVDGAIPPLTLENAHPKEIVDLTLEEAVRIALENSKVMRNLGGVAFGPNGAQGEAGTLLTNPDGAPTTYLPALSESDPRFGTEAALSAFDAQFTSSVFWEKNDTPQNVAQIVQFFRPKVFAQNLGTFQAQLRKTAATGTTWSLTHNVRYEWNNSTSSRKWPSDWNTNVEAEVRQPFLQGAGVQYNRIAGPGAIPGFNAGVMIARVRTDITLTDFEASVRNLVNDVERAYWNLYFAYRRLDTAVVGRDSTLRAWRAVNEKRKAGYRGGATQHEAQARQQLFLFQGVVEQSQSNLYKTESLLRYTMGLAATDGRLFRPADEPTTAKLDSDWYEIQAEGMARAVELRRQRWRVKQRELELIAAKNYLMPRLDFVGRYRWLGLGDTLIDSQNDVDADGDITNAYGAMTNGRFQEWQLGWEFSMPFGFRKEMAGVRNAQLALARERAVLQEQELELSHQLANAIRDIDEFYVTTKTNFNRVLAAKIEAEARREVWDRGASPRDEGDPLNLLLNAVQRQAEAENDYYRSLVDYNLAITQLHFRKGSLLEYNGIHLAEGPWPGKAYFDATRRARGRDAGYYLDYGFTRPKVISRGPYQQHAGQSELPWDVEPETPGSELPEIIPTPDPLPARPAAPGENLQSILETPRTAGPAQEEWSGLPHPRAQAAGKFDLAAHLGVLSPAGQAPAVRQVSYQQEAGTETRSAGAKTSAMRWKDASQADLQHEPVKDLPTAETDRPASGWKRAKR